VNNILYNNNVSDNAQIWVQTQVGVYGNTYKNNLFFKEDASNLISFNSWTYRHDSTKFKTVEQLNFLSDSSGNLMSGNISADPSFFAGLPFNYRIYASSAAKYAGFNVGLSTDYDGSLWNNPPSIGAYEYSYSPSIQTVLGQFVISLNNKLILVGGKFLTV